MRTNTQHDRTGSRAKWVFMGFVLVAGYFLAIEHREHLSGLTQYLPLLLLAACPLMHMFMHGHHGHHHSPSRSDERSPVEAERK